MRHNPSFKIIAVLSYLLALAVAFASLGGLFLPDTYAKETVSWAAQGVGQDAVNLLFVVPLLGVSTFLAQMGRRIILFILGGIYVYSIYSYS